MGDTQQKAVYAWEDEWADWNRPAASKCAVRKAIRKAERIYRIEPVTISFPKRNRGSVKDRRNGKGRTLSSDYDPAMHTIRIRPRHQNIAIGLHEVAHAIHDTLFGSWPGSKTEVHGPIWLGIYLTLLIKAKLAPRDALLASAKRAGLRWAPLGKVIPSRIRYNYRGLIEAAEFV